MIRYWVVLLLLPLSAQAFYQVQRDDIALEVRGLVTGMGIAANNPNDELLFVHDKILTGGGFGRLMLDVQTSDFSLEAHAVQSYIEPALRTGGSRVAAALEIERSDALHWRFADQHADLVIDRLNMQFSGKDLNIKIGRQPINLATTYYFTPNDFFAPFSAQTFYRTYKPGVDAARLDWQWGNLSQLSLYAVLNYPSQVGTNHRTSSPDWHQTSLLARGSMLIDTFEWALLIGQDHGDDIMGFDFQGDLFDWLGVRGEGHLRFPDESNQARDAKIALSLEHRFENSLTIRLEQFYQRSGVTDEQSYSLLDQASQNRFYLARNYTALGASYEFSPLLNGDAVCLYNHHDQSALLALYSTYSLSDESELSMGVILPVGEKPQQGIVQSEFGFYSTSVNVEYRLYF